MNFAGPSPEPVSFGLPQLSQGNDRHDSFLETLAADLFFISDSALIEELLLEQIKEDEKRTFSALPLPPPQQLTPQASIQSVSNPEEVLGMRTFEQAFPGEGGFEGFADENEGEDLEGRGIPQNGGAPMDPNVIGAPQRRPPNEMKNHQGAIVGRIEKLCKKDTATGRNFQLFTRATQELNEQQKEEFRKWVFTKPKKTKVWKDIGKFLTTNLVFAGIYIEMVRLFLSKKFKAVYEEYLSHKGGQLRKKAQDLLEKEKNKEFYRWKFQRVKELAEREAGGEEINWDMDMRQSRRSLKLI